jgi:FixJ family two-component response regulator
MHKCVAVVDDDESVCRSVGRLLRAVGIDAVSYHSAEALIADGRPTDFDCLVLDIQLHGMSGIDLCRHLTAAGWRTPVVFITEHDETEVRAQALLTGCAAFLRKNETGQVVVAAIERAMGSRQYADAPRLRC